MWNGRHGKYNWNKDGFRVYLGRHLKEVAISLEPWSDFLQTAWTKNKTDIENWMVVSKTTWWLWKGHKLSLQRENISMLAITEMQPLHFVFG
jgi:hypothetical protein